MAFTLTLKNTAVHWTQDCAVYTAPPKSAHSITVDLTGVCSDKPGGPLPLLPELPVEQLQPGALQEAALHPVGLHVPGQLERLAPGGGRQAGREAGEGRLDS